MKYHILHDPEPEFKKDSEEERKLTELLEGKKLIWRDITALDSVSSYIRSSVAPGDVILICGGDGTMSHFANDINGMNINNEIDYFSTGMGSDFLRDLALGKGELAKNINRYLVDLPQVTVNSKTCVFINGVGFGLDGYCCEARDELQRNGETDINYAAIALKGMLFRFKPLNAEVTVDGVTTSYKKVWLASTMKGRFYGGGMMPAPGQKRIAEENLLSVLIWSGSGIFRTLALFPMIFRGQHLRYKKICRCFTGKKITVRFDKPCALQIDGDTISNVTEYTAQV